MLYFQIKFNIKITEIIVKNNDETMRVQKSCEFFKVNLNNIFDQISSKFHNKTT